MPKGSPGDTVVLVPGLYHGPIVIERPVTLEGEPPGAVVDGGGQGNVITVAAPDVVIRGLTIRNSGISLEKMNSGIFVGKAGDRALIENNDIDHNLWQSHFWGPRDAIAGYPHRRTA